MQFEAQDTAENEEIVLEGIVKNGKHYLNQKV